MGTSQKSLLIIFYRNPRLGAVKTRLAATLGKERALAIFQKLALHTKNITARLVMDKAVFYSDVVEQDDVWPPSAFLKLEQNGADLGERMKNAFANGFDMGYDTISIIGTDCHELTGAIIDQAFESLASVDAVVGPAADGGYYLLGMRKFYPALFNGKQWSTDTVLKETVEDFESMGLTYSKLQVLHDVDRKEDLPANWIDGP
ncbi:MAG: TIGR04282 family arsenosugar biosynthesis glycosyltransferase [Bacteroidota bacterium]|nr:TIGR04282 family arsenosugar biosynthesis glycosyltransferase [Bacteroidota bacterium]